MKNLLILTAVVAILTSCGILKDEPKPKTIATVVTDEVSNITATGATVAGEVVTDGNAAVTERGVAYGTSMNPTIDGSKVAAGAGTGSFTADISGLIAASTYHVRTYAVNSIGVAYGADRTFSTVVGVPIVSATTGVVTSSFSATMGGSIQSDQGAAITESGVCFGKTTAPTVSGSKSFATGGSGIYATDVNGLEPGTKYYLRAFATNSVGTSYGPEISIRTDDNKVIDVDGNSYTFVKIGDQIWLGEDLRVSRYRNGDLILEITDAAAWSQLLTGAFCFYENSPSNNSTYGKLYNWYAAADSRGICPIGWKTPSDADWSTLGAALGGLSVAGGKLKSNTTWAAPNTGATNETQFAAQPGGYRRTAGGFERLTLDYWCWTSTEYSATRVSTAGMDYLSTNVSLGGGVGNEKKYGFSLRCIKE